MTAISKPLDVLLLDAGCSEEFIEYAMSHQTSFNGNMGKFIDLIEHLMQTDDESKEHAGTDKSTMDSGAKRVEHDYTGDNLTSGGYDHVDQGRRW